MASIRKKTWRNKKGQKCFSWGVEWRDQNGRSRSKFDRKWSHEEAKNYADDIEALQKSVGATSVRERWTVSDWLKDYGRRASISGIDGAKPVGTARAKQFEWFAKRICEVSGGVYLEKLTAVDMRRFRNDLLESGLDRRSAREILNHFKSALADAKRHQLVLTDFWSDVKVVAESSARPVRENDDEVDDDDDDDDADDADDDDDDDGAAMPTRSQMRHLLQVAKSLRDDPAKALGWEPDSDATWRKHHDAKGPRGWNVAAQAWRRGYVIVLLAALTGLRQGEIRGLYKRDIRFDEGVIRVRRAADKLNNLKRPKSKAGRRNVPMPPELAEELSAWLEVAPSGKLLFATRTGRVMDRSNVYHKVWKRLLEHADMSNCGLSFHSLRHYYASSLIAAGLGPLDVKKIMGHAKIGTTYDLYGGLFPEDDKHRKAAASHVTHALLSN